MNSASRYTVVSLSDHRALSAEVEKLLGEGWQPHGELHVTAVGTELRFTQALTRQQTAESAQERRRMGATTYER